MDYYSGGGESEKVEVIEEGKIVEVSEDYALREGLPILRKSSINVEENSEKVESRKEEEERRLLMDDYRKPLDWRDNKIVKELVDNFHWHILRERRRKGISRKEFSEGIGESENTIKMIENGTMPKNDFDLINKIQDFLGLKLRKVEQKFGDVGEMRKLVEGSGETEGKKVQGDKLELTGNDIEIVEDDNL